MNSWSIPTPLCASHRWQDQQQRRIGITGGIASGKSSIGSYLLSRGLPVLDADLYAHEALMPGSHLTEAVVQRFGSRVEQQLKSGEEAIGCLLYTSDAADE